MRDYRKEYLRYGSRPEQKKRRAARNRVRRQFLREGRVKKHDGKEIDHKNHNPHDDSPDNLRVVSASRNRGFTRDKNNKPTSQELSAYIEGLTELMNRRGFLKGIAGLITAPAPAQKEVAAVAKKALGKGMKVGVRGTGIDPEYSKILAKYAHGGVLGPIGRRKLEAQGIRSNRPMWLRKEDFLASSDDAALLGGKLPSSWSRTIYWGDGNPPTKTISKIGEEHRETLRRSIKNIAPVAGKKVSIEDQKEIMRRYRRQKILRTKRKIRQRERLNPHPIGGNPNRPMEFEAKLVAGLTELMNRRGFLKGIAGLIASPKPTAKEAASLVKTAAKVNPVNPRNWERGVAMAKSDIADSIFNKALLKYGSSKGLGPAGKAMIQKHEVRPYFDDWYDGEHGSKIVNKIHRELKGRGEWGVRDVASQLKGMARNLVQKKSYWADVMRQKSGRYRVPSIDGGGAEITKGTRAGYEATIKAMGPPATFSKRDLKPRSFAYQRKVVKRAQKIEMLKRRKRSDRLHPHPIGGNPNRPMEFGAKPAVRT